MKWRNIDWLPIKIVSIVLIMTAIGLFWIYEVTTMLAPGVDKGIHWIDKKISGGPDTTITIVNGKADTTVIIKK